MQGAKRSLASLFPLIRKKAVDETVIVTATKEVHVNVKSDSKHKRVIADSSDEEELIKRVKVIETEETPEKEMTETRELESSPDKKTASITTTTSSTSKGTPTQEITYSDLCATFLKIESTTKRIQITEYLSEYMTGIIKHAPECLLPVVYLCLNKICPEYEGIELGVGESLIIKAVANACCSTVKNVKDELAKIGDLGDVAQTGRSKQKTLFLPKPLSVTHVFKTLKEVATIAGTASQKKKIDKINTLLVACRGAETKFLVRGLEGKLRIGLAEQTVLTALAHASVMSRSQAKREKLASEFEDAEATLKAVYNELPTYDLVIPFLIEHGVSNLPKYCKLTPGIPLKPMLAHPTKSLTEVLNRFEGIAFTCEYKYDGERAQIHLLDDGTSMIFSRNSENLSGKYPDILARLKKATREGTKSFVLDCETVAWDLKDKCILPFQVLSTRKRKGVEEKDIQVQVCVFAFDLLFLNGEPVTGLTLSERRVLLQETFVAVEGEFQFAKYLDTDNVDEMQLFLEDSITGLMVKTLTTDSTYEPSKRSRNWLKVKKDYLSGIGDTVDLVVIGAYLGRGKRTGSYGGYLLACYDVENDEYQSICKIGTGFSDADLVSQYASLTEHIIDQPKPYYKFDDAPNLRPDVWFNAHQVWEVKCADLSISPVYQAAIGHVDANKGISLRFPRFIKLREDKGPELATDAVQIAELYNQQQINGKTSTKDTGGDDE